ncbi:TonB-dependent receptor plug domain-containing protein [Piscinibacter sp.]|uniref:TonB-dependent receptor plug domain-containing protein n=1 Tax=Piscinibacter sp. TaxID=1903157 RepID=UPI002BAC41AD|nr:TonB-dependent receptor [Albitalea sp.]HUG21202.1 TonB-dependent receptor [Albitalea sp.]
MTPVLPLLAGALAMQVSGALAQAVSEEEELALVYGDKSTVSIATGTPQSLRRAPAVATVITAQEIAAMGAVNLDDVLETVPGIHVGRSNVNYTPLYLIRGIHSEFNPQTLMLQNGVPMTTMFIGNRGLGWGGLPVENIARIEIIRGPGSALYGADAYSGVINIITKNAADVAGTEFGVRAGSFDTKDGWVQHGGTLGPVDVAAYVRVGHTDGFKEIVGADAQTGLDALFMTSASLAPGPVNTGYDSVDGHLDLSYGQWRFRGGYKLRDNVESGAGVAAALDPVGRHRSERITADLSLGDLQIARDLRLGLMASYFHYTQKLTTPLQLFPPGAFGGAFPDGVFGAPNTWERHLRLSAVASYSGLEDHHLRLGLGHDNLDLYRTQEFKNFTIVTSGPAKGLPVPTPDGAVREFPVEESFLVPHGRKVTYVYAQDEWNFARDWTLTGGIRHDRYSDFGATTNPRAALVWDASLDLTAKLLYGRAFRAPALTEQHSINNPVIRGNPNLRPETIETLESAFAWQARPDTHVNLSLFRYRMKDIIRTTDVGEGTTMFDNVGTQRGHGVELEANWDVRHNLRLAGHYAYQRSTDETSGQDAGYAPHHQVFARMDYGFAGGWLFSAQAKHVADRKRAPTDLRQDDIADFTTADVTLRTTRGKDRWNLAASVRNLFDADVREPSLAPGVSLPDDLPMAGRSLYVQAVYRF